MRTAPITPPASDSGVDPSVARTIRRQTKEIMGMPVTIQLMDSDPNPAALNQAFAQFILLDETFSPFLAASAISRINRGELRVEDAPALIHQALQICALYEQATDGYFSPHLAGHLDCNGLVKGWAIDRACSVLANAGYHDYFVDAGGDVATRGHNPQGDPWRVGIRHPIEHDKVACVVLARDLAVATSGTYEKGEHILDPHTALPVTHWLSFTVVGVDILSADVYSTAACAMGQDGIEFITHQDGYEAYAIDSNLRATYTDGFKALCAPLT
jgi:thiamine biosynthesis lipoprotein